MINHIYDGMLNSIVKKKQYLSSTLVTTECPKKYIISIHKFTHIIYQAYGHATLQLTL